MYLFSRWAGAVDGLQKPDLLAAGGGRRLGQRGGFRQHGHMTLEGESTVVRAWLLVQQPGAPPRPGKGEQGALRRRGLSRTGKWLTVGPSPRDLRARWAWSQARLESDEPTGPGSSTGLSAACRNSLTPLSLSVNLRKWGQGRFHHNAVRRV